VVLAGVTDNASVTFYQSTKDSSKGWAFTEAISGSYAVDRDRLQTLQNLKSVFKGEGLKGALTSAHPKEMPNGRHVNVLIATPFGEFQVRLLLASL
jgi:hypothetical protein